MTKPAHTPGPWAIFEDEDFVPECPGIEAPSCTIVIYGTNLTDDGEYCGVQGRTVAEAKANAHMMTAAPEMYDALATCVQKLRVCAISAGNDPEIVDIMLEPYLATLAKARGEP
jgi:hypothetical protein